MVLKHYTDKKCVHLLATKTRRTDITPYELAMAHVELGKYLAYEFLESIALEECDINHPQGIKKGMRIKDEQDIVLIVFMRAGIYMGEGFRAVFQNAPCIHVHPVRGKGLQEADWKDLPDLEKKHVVILDSVINTGATLVSVLSQIRQKKPSRISVCGLVMPVPTAESLEKGHEYVDFYIARVSENQYVGKGKTDTGNRLFGTF